jgi:uncharacterized protein (DUF2249 family)
MSMSASVVLDVSPILVRGEEPFSHIQRCVSELREGQSLLLKAPFEPTPLYVFMRQRGYQEHAKQLPSGLWEILFVPVEDALPESAQDLDLRDLEPPEPMRRALEAATSLGRNEVLTIHTRFRPVHLLDRLEELGFIHDSEECAPDHWETHIWRSCECTI